MTTMYKFTEHDWTTRNKTKWGPNVTHTASGKGPICSEGYLHAYTNPILAELLRPIHVEFTKPVLWLAEGTVAINDNDLKVGCSSLTTLKIIETPVITKNQRIRFAILCAKAVYKDRSWNNWANNWLNGSDRTIASAYANAATNAAVAVNAAYAAARAGIPLDLISLAKEAVYG